MKLSPSPEKEMPKYGGNYKKFITAGKKVPCTHTFLIPTLRDNYEL